MPAAWPSLFWWIDLLCMHGAKRFRFTPWALWVRLKRRGRARSKTHNGNYSLL